MIGHTTRVLNNNKIIIMYSWSQSTSSSVCVHDCVCACVRVHVCYISVHACGYRFNNEMGMIFAAFTNILTNHKVLLV